MPQRRGEDMPPKPWMVRKATSSSMPWIAHSASGDEADHRQQEGLAPRDRELAAIGTMIVSHQVSLDDRSNIEAVPVSRRCAARVRQSSIERGEQECSMVPATLRSSPSCQPSVGSLSAGCLAGVDVVSHALLLCDASAVHVFDQAQQVCRNSSTPRGEAGRILSCHSSPGPMPRALPTGWREPGVGLPASSDRDTLHHASRSRVIISP